MGLAGFYLYFYLKSANSSALSLFYTEATRDLNATWTFLNSESQGNMQGQLRTVTVTPEEGLPQTSDLGVHGPWGLDQKHLHQNHENERTNSSQILCTCKG